MWIYIISLIVLSFHSWCINLISILIHLKITPHLIGKTPPLPSNKAMRYIRGVLFWSITASENTEERLTEKIEWFHKNMYRFIALLNLSSVQVRFLKYAFKYTIKFFDLKIFDLKKSIYFLIRGINSVDIGRNSREKN